MLKTKQEYKTIWHYADWLLSSGRLTIEEHSELYRLADKLELDTVEDCL